jgi:apolipoprotein N-acyltransferase
MDPGDKTPFRRSPLVMGPIALASLSALLLFLAQPPFHFILLPFTALVPLGVALGSLNEDERSGWSAAWVGVAFGALYWGVLLAWVPLVVAPRFPWAYPGYGVQVGLLAGLMGLMAWGTHRLHRSAALPLSLSLPLAWVGMEYLKGHFPFGLSFPWLGLGISLTGWPELLGLAEWTGEGGVAFWLALVNGLLASALLRVNSGGPGKSGSLSPLRLATLAVVTALLPALAGVLRARTLPLVEGPRVAVVGTEVPVAFRLRSVEGSRMALAQIEAKMEGLGPGEVDLVVLPEATISLPLDGAHGVEFREALGGLARRVGAPVLVGALGEEPVANSAFLLGSDGSILSRYDKSRLVPGMESGGYQKGPSGQILEAGGVTLAPLICYESLFGELARSQRRAGATLMVNLTSDSWFGGGGVGMLFLHQHPAHLVMRAVETRMGVARAANGGFSFLLDPGGRLLSPPVLPGAGMALATIPVLRGGTVFSLTGDLIGPLALLLVCLLLGWPILRQRNQSAPSA